MLYVYVYSSHQHCQSPKYICFTDGQTQGYIFYILGEIFDENKAKKEANGKSERALKKFLFWEENLFRFTNGELGNLLLFFFAI